MHRRIECPSCSMTASRNDRRHFPMIAAESAELRACRNCGASLVVKDDLVVVGSTFGVMSTR